MSDALIVRRGGSGMSTNGAVIHVTAPAGSTITFSKNGIIAKTLGPTKGHVSDADTDFAEYYAAFTPGNYGEWTVTASLGPQSVDGIVTLEENRQYDIALGYRVPAEYRAVEYLESTKAQQYIVLDIDTTQPMKSLLVDITFMQTGDSNSTIIGHQAGSPYFLAQISSSGTTLIARASGGNTRSVTVASATEQKRRLQYENGIFKYEGTQVLDESSYIGVLASKLGLMDLYSTFPGNSRLRIYEAKVSTGSTSFELVPCYRKADSVKGFWDRINKAFRPSDGTNPFEVVGPDL